MDVYLDDAKTTFVPATDSTLAEMVHSFKAKLAESGRILVTVCCDGIAAAGDEYERTLAQRCDKVTRVDLHSAEPGALLRSALTAAGEMLEGTTATAEAIVTALNQGDHNGAMDGLGDCCRVWLDVHRAICDAAGLLHIDPATFLVEGQPLLQVLGVPLEKLRMIKEVIEVRDFVLLSDILAYEFGDAVAGWRKALQALSAADTPTPVR